MKSQLAPEPDGVAQARDLLAEASEEVDRLENVAGQAFRRLTALTGMLARLERLAVSHQPEAVETAALDAATGIGTDELEGLIQRNLIGRISVRDLRVRVEAGGLVLQGRAATYYAKQLAQHAATAVSGLPVRSNDIKVR
ncbi:MAG TPA: BON domain-containing protein [Gemmataceae bacterium]